MILGSGSTQNTLLRLNPRYSNLRNHFKCTVGRAPTLGRVHTFTQKELYSKTVKALLKVQDQFKTHFLGFIRLF